MSGTYAEVLRLIQERFDERPGLRKVFLDKIAQRRGWTASYAQQTRRLAQWNDENDHHPWPLDAVDLLIETFDGDDSFLDPFLGHATRVKREARGRERIGPMRSVRPETRRREIA